MSELSGVKVAMRPVGVSSATDAAVTTVTPGPVRIKVPVVTVAGSIRKPEGTVKVALTLELEHTAGAPAAGLVESTETDADGAAVAVVKVHT